jgi:hypothetical protein
MKWGFATFVRRGRMRKTLFSARKPAKRSISLARTKNPIIIIILHQHLGNAAAAIHYISRAAAAPTFVRRLFILRPCARAREPLR